MKNKASWKNKIDPAFPTFIRAINDAFKLADEAEGETPEEVMNHLQSEGTLSFKTLYEEGSAPSPALDFADAISSGDIATKINAIGESARKKDRASVYQSLIDVFDAFDSESREFYLKAFDFLSSEEKSKAVDQMKKEELDNQIKIYQTNINMMALHLFVKGFDIEQVHRDPISVASKVSPNSLLRLNFSMLDKIATLVHKKSLKVLYQEAKGGNEKSLFILLRYDKSLFDHEWLRALVARKMVTGDETFFKKIGQAFSSFPPIGKLKQAKLKYILLNLWSVGLSLLTIPELIQVLEESGMKVHEDPESLRKFIQVQIKPLVG